jgi:hypothetical protein
MGLRRRRHSTRRRALLALAVGSATALAAAGVASGTSPAGEVPTAAAASKQVPPPGAAPLTVRIPPNADDEFEAPAELQQFGQAPAISADGRYVAFESEVALLDETPDETDDQSNGFFDIYLEDRDSDRDGILDEPGGTRLILVSLAEEPEPIGFGLRRRAVFDQSGGDSFDADISSNGRFVVFTSVAPNLDADFPAGDSDGGQFQPDVFLWDGDRNGNGILAENEADVAVFFASRNGSFDDEAPVVDPSVADNGQVAFRGDEIENEGDLGPSVYVRTNTGADGSEPTYLNVPHTFHGSPSDSFMFAPVISANGRQVIFTFTNFDEESQGIGVHDRDLDADGILDEPGPANARTGELEFIDEEGGRTEDFPGSPSELTLSADGTVIAYTSFFDFGGSALRQALFTPQVFLVTRSLAPAGDLADTISQQTLSQTAAGDLGTDESRFPAVSSDGRYAAFATAAPNLLPATSSQCEGPPTSSEPEVVTCAQVILVDRTAPAGRTTEFVSLNRQGVTGNSDSIAPVIAVRNGALMVAFESAADDLLGAGGDTNELVDVFVRNFAPPAFQTNPAVLAFGERPIGTSAGVRTVIVTANGRGQITVGAVSLAGQFPGDYRIVADTCSGVTLFSFGFCTVMVEQTPGGVGSRPAVLRFDDTVPGSPHLVTLTGSGAPPTMQPNPAVTMSGRVISVEGTQWPPGAQVEVTIEHLPAPILVTVGPDGTATLPVVILRSRTWGPRRVDAHVVGDPSLASVTQFLLVQAESTDPGEFVTR